MIKTLSTYHDCEKERPSAKQQYRRVYCVVFFMFFWIAAWSRLLPRSLRPLAMTIGGGESIWQEASRAAHTAVGFAFKG